MEQELIYEKLPGDIAKRHVLLMDPILATGNSAARAIQVRQLKPAAVQVLAAAVQSWLLLCNLCLLRLAPAPYQGLLVCCALNMLPIAASCDVGNELLQHCDIDCSLDICHTCILYPQGNLRICPISKALLGQLMSLTADKHSKHAHKGC